MTIQDLQYYNYFSFAMYCPTTLETLTCPYCQHFNETVTEFEIFYNEIYATKGMVTLHGELDEIVVVFRGTVAITNWILDYATFPTPMGHDGIEVHTGFLLDLMSIYNPVRTGVCYPGFFGFFGFWWVLEVAKISNTQG